MQLELVMRPANLDVLFKAANAHFHLTALETVSSPGTRMIPTWSRVKHNPGNLLRCYKIGPFCMASAFGCWKSLHQQYLFYWLIFLQSVAFWLHSQMGSCIFAIYHLYKQWFLHRSFSHSRTPGEQRDCNIHFIQWLPHLGFQSSKILQNPGVLH